MRTQHPLPDQAAEALYALAGAREEDHFVLTSSGAESINHVVSATYLDVSRQTGKNHFMTSAVEEAAIVLSMSRLQQMGCAFQMTEVQNNGNVTPEILAESFTPRTALVSLSWANGLTGVIQPIEAIAALCRDRGIYLHVDATHALGKGDFTFEKSGADFLTFDCGVPGTGALFIRNGVSLSPLIVGECHQEQMRCGLFHPIVIQELIDLSSRKLSGMEAFCMESAHRRWQFEKQMCSLIPQVQVLFKEEPRIPDTAVLAFGNVSSEALAYRLDRTAVVSHFGGGAFQKMQHVLKAARQSESVCQSALRFCFAQDSDVEAAACTIAEIVKQLRRVTEHLPMETSNA